MATFILEPTTDELIPELSEEQKIVIQQNANLLSEYADTVAAIKELEAKKDAINERLLEIMTRAGADTFKTRYGTFSRCSRTTLSYTDEVESQLSILKDNAAQIKNAAERAGQVTEKVSSFIRYQK